MPKIFKIPYYLILTILGLIILTLLFSILPIKGNLELLAVKSGSMEPSIHRGSLVITKPFSSYQIGDIITFQNPQDPKTPITHRVVAVNHNKYETKGDANQTSDKNQLSKSVIQGKVIFHLPYAGFVLAGVRQPIVFILIIIIIAGIIIYDEAKKIKKEVVKIKSHKNNQDTALNDRQESE